MQNIINARYSANTCKPNHAGFTLLELMVVVVIIGILAAIAIPAYTSSVQKSRRTDAKNALLDLATKEEKWYSVNNAYSVTASDLYGSSSSYPLAVQTGSTPYYNLSVTSSSASAAATTSGTAAAYFFATAVPIDPQTADTACYTFTIDSFGVTGNVDSNSSALTGTNCW